MVGPGKTRYSVQMSHCKSAHRDTAERAAMLRRGRNGRVRHAAWSETRQETDVLAMIQTSSWEERDGQAASQVSDPEPEAEHLESPQSASEVVALPCTGPVIGESFCPCNLQEDPITGICTECSCGEQDEDFEWEWDDHFKTSGAVLSCDNRKVSFHADYSCGTAAIRGTKELTDGHHFWEVKMTSPVYGTDMMVGIGTSEVNMEKFKYSFGSLLGHDEESWGLSYTGHLQHKGDKVMFSSRFGQGSIIGVHLDTWRGTLTFYKNRHCIAGVAATKLKNKKFYPMVCSTAAKSSMKVIRACYTPTTLQYLCCAQLRQTFSNCPDTLKALDLPPGLQTRLQMQLGWVFTLNHSNSSSSSSSSSSRPEAPKQCWDFPEELYEEDLSPGPSPVPSPVPSPRACAFLSPCSCSPPPNTDPPLCSCQTSLHSTPCTCQCPPTPPSSNYDSCCSEPEDFQCKRCRWT